MVRERFCNAENLEDLIYLKVHLVRRYAAVLKQQNMHKLDFKFVNTIYSHLCMHKLKWKYLPKRSEFPMSLGVPGL